MGQDGFIWWLGVVEDVADPMLLGRAKVRIFGYHPQYKEDETTSNSVNRVPIADLPWAVPILPLNMVNAYGRMKLGEWVFGFFMDGKEAQEPAMVGYIPHIPGKDMPKPDELFGRYGDNVRNFSHVYTNAYGEQFRPQDFAQAGKEYSHRLDRFSFKTASGHMIELIDDLTDIHTRDIQLSHANGSKIKATADHLGNSDLTISERGGQSIKISTDKVGNKETKITEGGGQSIKMTTTSSGDCTINITHPKGSTITIAPNGQISISSPESIAVSSSKAVSISGTTGVTVTAPTIALASSTTNNQNVMNTNTLNANLINLSGVGNLATKIAQMDAQIELAKSLPNLAPLYSQVSSLGYQTSSLGSQIYNLTQQVNALS